LIMQVYTPASECEDDEVEKLYDQNWRNSRRRLKGWHKNHHNGGLE
jgi:hypothetical protein